MSKRSITTALAIALLLQSGGAFAQRVQNPRVRELQAQYDSIWPRLVAAEAAYKARAEAARQAEAARLAVKLDTATVGPFMVVALPASLGPAREYVADLWREFETYARGAEGRLTGLTLLVEDDEAVAMFRPMAQRPRHLLLQLPTMLSPNARRAYGARAVGGHLSALTPAPVRQWLSGAQLSTEHDDTRIYRELAVGRSHAAQRCFRRDVAGCRAALALLPPDSQWSTWYTAPQLRQIAIESVSGWTGVRNRLLDACVKQDQAASCAAFLRQSHGAPAPLSNAARAAFLHYALERGGEGSYARLLSAQGDIEHAIAMAAGEPIDRLVDGWRGEIQRARPEMHAGATRSRLAILFWLLVCVGLAMRSTRWRNA